MAPETLQQNALNSKTKQQNLFLVLSVCFSQIVDSPEVWTESTDQRSSLVITEAKAHHTGRYTIVVKDRKSSTQHSLTLSVIGKSNHKVLKLK